jgi:hypothetical protein
MARPGKSVAEKIEVLDSKISKLTEKLLSLKQERKALEAQQKEADFAELLNVMKEKGMTAAQLKDMISQPEQQQEEQPQQQW